MSEKTGVLFINIGTPESPQKKHVKKFLQKFLMDRHVINLPWILRVILVFGFILPFRTLRSAKAYEKIWQEEGSPLLMISENFVDAVSRVLGQENFLVSLGMCYGKPSIQDALQQLLEKNITKLIVVPLYPQYAEATTQAAIAQVKKIISPKTIPLIFVNSFFQENFFIDGISNIAKQINPNPQAWVFSYHGLPMSAVKKVCSSVCDQNTSCSFLTKENVLCYRAQCFATTRQLITNLNLNPEICFTAFQSQLGKTPWTKPNLISVLEDLRKKNIEDVAIVCPSFVADCLETLEEINIRAKLLWETLGGKQFTLLPCLNDNGDWVKGFAGVLKTL